MRKKVLVGMSGGVDSATTAALLIEKGYDVSGVTLLLTKESNEKTAEDAKASAKRLNIPHYVWDFKDLFNQRVVNYFVNEYFEGRTPNPCIMCNKTIKFGMLYDRAMEEGYDFIATGHYAKIKEQNGRFYLCKGDDQKKDQSYFLYNLKEEMLSKILLPLGEYTKEQTREMAKKFNITVATKPDSQEICFIPDNDYGKFVESSTDKKADHGDILDKYGKVVGKHLGIYKYTIGQRKGLGAFGRPVFVTGIYPKNNTITIGEQGDEMGFELVADNINMISEPFVGQSEVMAKIRYKAPDAKALITPLKDGKVHVKFEKPQRAITPGQSVVFYKDDIVLGGGTII